MTKIDLQYDLLNYTPASASPVEANFERVEQHVNQELVERDGTVAMRAQLKLVGNPIQALDAAPKQYVDQVLPIGIIMMYGGAGAPPGGRWAECNGAELQTATYPELFAILGTAYGGTAGRFNLPNLTDRFPRGSAPGTTGGTADAVIVDHDHAINLSSEWTGTDHFHAVSIQSGGESAAHFHRPANPETGAGGWDGFIVYDAGGGAYSGGAAGVTQGIEATTHWNEQGHTHGVNGNTGGQSVNHAHAVNGRSAGTPNASSHVNANIPPYVGVTYILRVQ